MKLLENRTITEEDITGKFINKCKIIYHEQTKEGEYKIFLKCTCGNTLSYGRYITLDRKCPKCKEFILDVPRGEERRKLKAAVKAKKQKSKIFDKTKELIGTSTGEYTIIDILTNKVTLKCINGTSKTLSRSALTRDLKNCSCNKCQPSHGYSQGEYGRQWGVIKDQEKYWDNYYEFEDWVIKFLPKPVDKPSLCKINKDLPWQPDNIAWGGAGGEIHLSIWKERIKVDEKVELMGRSKGRVSGSLGFSFRCSKGHNFFREQCSVMLSMRTGNPVSCPTCLEEARIEKNKLKQKLIKQIPPIDKIVVVHEKLKRRTTPSVTLIGEYKSKSEIGVFECSECNTSHKMLILAAHQRKVCPICKSEKLAEKCDIRVEKRFKGKIKRTGIWRTAGSATSWKCIEHNIHFIKSYDKIIGTTSGGCNECINHGTDYEAPTRVYYVRIKYKGTYVYKIGITQCEGLKRFDKEIAKSKVTLIKEWTYSTWQEAWDVEHRILSKYSEELLGERVLRESGNTEIFYKDVLKLDNL